MAVGLDLRILSRSQLRESLTDAFQKLTFVRETIENIPKAHIPFPRLQEVSFLEQRVAEYQLELARRRTLDTPVRIFYSYSRSDESFLVDLNEHLAELKSGRPIEVFWDRNLPPGVEWHAETMAELRDADVVLLLISPDFLASRYCQYVELPASLSLHDCGLAVVIPVIIRTCNWLDTPLGRLQAVSAGGTPIFESKDRQAALAEAARSVFRMIGLFGLANPQPL
jgi:hypothetical protein